MRHGRSKRHKQKRRLKRRTTRRLSVQRGGNGRNILDGSDAPMLVTGTPIDFNVRFQPTVVTNINGPTLTPYQTAHEPYAVWTAPTPPNMYTIICWDPDAPNKSYLHWLVANCPGENASGGKEVSAWKGPDPPYGSGEHRYVIGLFSQTKEIEAPLIENRSGFNATTFATTHGLTAVAYKGFRVMPTTTPPATNNAQQQEQQQQTAQMIPPPPPPQIPPPPQAPPPSQALPPPQPQNTPPVPIPVNVNAPPPA